MPLYEYGCHECGKRHEIVQKFQDPVLKDCPACGKPALEKLISQTSFQLKGGGWYASDYKKPTSTSTPKAAETTAEPAATKAAPACGAGGCGTKGDGGTSS
jgi:putative FmdB family regulatory protein